MELDVHDIAKSLDLFVGKELIRLSFDASQILLTFEDGEVAVESSIALHSVPSGLKIGSMSLSEVSPLKISSLIGQKVVSLKLEQDFLIIEFPLLTMSIEVENKGFESASIFFASDKISPIFL